MSKSNIVYFCIAVVCVLCVPVMAYIYLPAAFIYLLPAAVFFWLSKDITLRVLNIIAKFIISVYLKAKALIIKLYDLILSKAVRGRRDSYTDSQDLSDIIKQYSPVEPEPVAPPILEPPPVAPPPQPIYHEIAPPPVAPPPQPVYHEIAPPPEPSVTYPVTSHYKESDVYDVVKGQFDNLDMITISAIAIMLSDTNAKAGSPYIKTLQKTDIRAVLLRFLKDAYLATDIGQINKMFDKTYYKRKIHKYMKKVMIFVKSGISDSLPKKNMWLVSRLRVSSVQTKTYIEKICETISSFESVKYISALSGNKEISDSKRNYKLDHLSDNYKDALIYLVDFLLTCTCISKMLFVEKMIRKMPENSEFKKIIENMAKSIDDHNLIINKSRPVYKQFYQSELGYISGDDLLYGMAITIMVNNVKKTDEMDMDVSGSKYSSANFHIFERDMQAWLDELSKQDGCDDIGTLILRKITLTIKNDYDVLITALGELLTWESFYKQRVAFHRRERDKERYLRGDFENEVIEMSKFKQKQ